MQLSSLLVFCVIFSASVHCDDVTPVVTFASTCNSSIFYLNMFSQANYGFDFTSTELSATPTTVTLPAVSTQWFGFFYASTTQAQTGLFDAMTRIQFDLTNPGATVYYVDVRQGYNLNAFVNVTTSSGDNSLCNSVDFEAPENCFDGVSADAYSCVGSGDKSGIYVTSISTATNSKAMIGPNSAAAATQQCNPTITSYAVTFSCPVVASYN